MRLDPKHEIAAAVARCGDHLRACVRDTPHGLKSGGFSVYPSVLPLFQGSPTERLAWCPHDYLVPKPQDTLLFPLSCGRGFTRAPAALNRLQRVSKESPCRFAAP